MCRLNSVRLNTNAEKFVVYFWNALLFIKLRTSNGSYRPKWNTHTVVATNTMLLLVILHLNLALAAFLQGLRKGRTWVILARQWPLYLWNKRLVTKRVWITLGHFNFPCRQIDQCSRSGFHFVAVFIFFLVEHEVFLVFRQKLDRPEMSQRYVSMKELFSISNSFLRGKPGLWEKMAC